MATYTDTFTEAANVDLSAHTPDSGGLWAEVEDTAGTTAINVQAANDTASPFGNVNSGRVLYTVSWTPAAQHYSVSFTVISFSAGDDAAGVLARYVDTSNYYAMMIIATNVFITKKVGGTYTDLGSTSVTVANNDVWKFEVIGTSLKAFQNDVERLSVSDSDLTSAGLCGLAFGAVGAGATTMDVNTGWDLDDFTLVDIETSDITVSMTVGSTPITGRAPSMNFTIGMPSQP